MKHQAPGVDIDDPDQAIPAVLEHEIRRRGIELPQVVGGIDSSVGFADRHHAGVPPLVGIRHHHVFRLVFLDPAIHPAAYGAFTDIDFRAEPGPQGPEHVAGFDVRNLFDDRQNGALHLGIRVDRPGSSSHPVVIDERVDAAVELELRPAPDGGRMEGFAAQYFARILGKSDGAGSHFGTKDFLPLDLAQPRGFDELVTSGEDFKLGFRTLFLPVRQQIKLAPAFNPGLQDRVPAALLLRSHGLRFGFDRLDQLLLVGPGSLLA